jgi:hypothetical protein
VPFQARLAMRPQPEANLVPARQSEPDGAPPP